MGSSPGLCNFLIYLNNLIYYIKGGCLDVGLFVGLFVQILLANSS